MLKKTVTYTDYDGNVRTEDFYFNFSQAELTEMQFAYEGGLIKTISKIVAEKDEKRIMEIFKDLVLKSYGEKSPDGKRFMKDTERSTAFSQTEAYVEIFMSLVRDDNAASDFMNAVIPSIPAPLTPIK